MKPNQLFLPMYLTMEVLHSWYISSQEESIPVLSLNQFRSLFKTKYNHLLFSRNTRLAKCDSCINFSLWKASSRLLTSTQEKAVIFSYNHK